MHCVKHSTHTLSALHSAFSYLRPQETAVYHHTTTGSMPTDRKAISHIHTHIQTQGSHPLACSGTTLLNLSTAAAFMCFNVCTQAEYT